MQLVGAVLAGGGEPLAVIAVDGGGAALARGDEMAAAIGVTRHREQQGPGIAVVGLVEGIDRHHVAAPGAPAPGPQRQRRVGVADNGECFVAGRCERKVARDRRRVAGGPGGKMGQ